MKASLISILVTNFVLFSIMFGGLFRLRRQGGGMLDLGRLLSKQVRWPPYLRAIVLFFR